MNTLTPRVVRIRRSGGIVVQDCDVYIGRLCTQGGWYLQASKWANPFSVSKYGIDQSLQLYREYIVERIERDPIYYDLSELHGASLGCWCGNGRGTKCHGNVLIDIITERNQC